MIKIQTDHKYSKNFPSGVGRIFEICGKNTGDEKHAKGRSVKQYHNSFSTAYEITSDILI